ncbi:helix-turn-helix domain-containing protein [Curtobacterium sp. Curtsp57]|uniref:helix-turn-helix domain-containing protein n=1 Tax=Curtobacterium sp. Curtsp57 TaxID=3243047 RepID=UPI0039B3709A
MSLKVITWVLYEAPVTQQAHLLVLLALADRAHDDGTAAYPSREWIGDRARCSVRSVASHLRALEEAGLIRKGDQDLVAHFRADRRPVVYDVVMTAGNVCTPSVNDVQSDASRGARSRTHDVQPVAHKPSLFSYGEETVQKPSNARMNELFEEAWKTWPRKAGKQGARRAFDRLLRTQPLSMIRIVDAIAEHGKAYAQYVPEQYVPHLATWLNGARWEDDLPSPRGGRGQERQDEGLALVARLREQEEVSHAGIGGSAAAALGSGR